MTRLIVLIALVLFLFVSVPADASNIVYLGLDPGNGNGNPGQEIELIRNSARYAGGSADPKIGYLPTGGGFSGSGIGTKLTTAGFTDTTALLPGDLDTIDLNVYDVLYFGPTTDGLVIDEYQTAAPDILSYVSGGGGLVVEPNVFDADSWTWVPHASLIGHSGPANATDDTVVITDPGHPVMAGLTNAGLSNWSVSVHSNFSTPAAAGYSVLATNSAGTPVVIVREIPEPTTVALAGLGLLGMGWCRRRQV